MLLEECQDHSKFRSLASQKSLKGILWTEDMFLISSSILQYSIKWFQETLKSEGLYNILAAYEDKSATAICTLAFCPYPHADPVLFTGTIDGTIIAPVPGEGFGWDSIFVPEGHDAPFSTMTTEQKNQLSHRGKAVRQWAKWLGRNKEALLMRQEGIKAIGHKGLDFKSTSPEQ